MGCAPDVPLQRLQAFLGLLYGRCPELEAEVTHLPSALQRERLRDGRLDLGLVHGRGVGPGLEAVPLYRGEALAAVVSLEHPVAARATARIEDLAREVLLVVPRSSEPALHDRVAALAVTDGRPFRNVRDAPGPGVRDLLFAVASGHGVALAPRSTLRVAGDLGDAVVARSLRPAMRMPETCIAWPANGRPGLAGPYAAARRVAHELHRP